MPRPRRLGLLLAAGALASASGAPAGAAERTLNVNWQQGVAITITLPDGTPVTASSVIPPGTYAVVIYNDFRDDLSIARMFHLKGPGVDYQTDLNQGEQVQETWAVTFQPGSTYTWDDDYRASQVSGSFRTSSTVAAGGTTSTAGRGGTAPATSGPTTANTDIAASAPAFRGALDAIVLASGKVSLSRNGKAVRSLRTGRYTFSVDDESKGSGFVLKSLRGRPRTLTAAGYVGSHEVTVTLAPGRWFFYARPAAKSQFFVTS